MKYLRKLEGIVLVHLQEPAYEYDDSIGSAGRLAVHRTDLMPDSLKRQRHQLGHDAVNTAVLLPFKCQHGRLVVERTQVVTVGVEGGVIEGYELLTDGLKVGHYYEREG